MSEKAPAQNQKLARRAAPSPITFDQAFDALWHRAQASLGAFPLESSSLAAWPEFGSFALGTPTDIVDAGASYRITAEVPGFAKDQIEIKVTGNVVEISGEDKTETSATADGYLHRERSQSSFHRAFELPEPVLAESSKAKVVNGVLELELPKQTPTPQPAETRIPVE